MKIIEAAKRALGLGETEIEKARAGVYIARRLTPASAKRWHDWGVRHSIPGLLPAEEMHVTQMYSTTDVKVPLLQNTISFEVSSTYGARGCFAMFGAEEDHLVFAMENWELWERHWALCALGCSPTWSPYRPHLTLAETPVGYELPDAALEDVPRFINLGEEFSEGLKTKASEVETFDGADSQVITVDEATKARAAEVLKTAPAEMSVLTRYDIADVARGEVLAGVAKRLAQTSISADLVKSLRQVTRVQKRVEKDVVYTIKAAPKGLSERFSQTSICKSKAERQVALGIASISTEKGEHTDDLHGDQVTTDALIEFNYDILKGARASKFEHRGEAVGEVVAGLVLTEDWQKALDIDLGYEPYLVEIHVPDPQQWAEVKKGDWELSIAGRMWYYEDEDAAV